MTELCLGIDTGKTRTEPIDYSWRNQPGAGCLGTIDCKECGCIMAAQGSHCFCMGIYTCPRCGYESKGFVHHVDVEAFTTIGVDIPPSDGIVDPHYMVFNQLKELSQEDRAKVFRHFCRGCNRYLEEGDVCYCEKY
jgi:hypothetical protein